MKVSDTFENQTLEKWETLSYLIVCIVSFVFIFFVSSEREFFNFGTETDTIGGFIPEAKRILNGDPLSLSYHPPLYSFALALVYSLTKNWLYSGLLISVASSAIALVSIFYTIKLIAGIRAAAWASLIVITSPIFLIYSTWATSDLFFFAIYSTAIWSAFCSLNSNSNSNFRWIIPGFFIGMAMLTRTNGIVLILLTFLPFFVSEKIGKRFKRFLTCWSGVFFISCLWAIYAFMTDSNITPANNVNNVAMTYFGIGDRISNESLRSVTQNFNSYIDVFFYDPKVVVITYIKDLYDLFSENLYLLTSFPYSKLLFAGILIVPILCWRNFNILVYTVLIIAHLLLVNLKTFEPRFYLFTLPLFGIGIGYLIHHIFQSLPNSICAKLFYASIVIGIFMISIWSALSLTIGKHKNNKSEIYEAVPIAKSLIKKDDVVIARKGVIAIHTQAKNVFYPDTTSLETLKKEICSKYIYKNRETWLYYGAKELKLRPKHKELAEPKEVPQWLIPIKFGQKSPWVLYKANCS